jgi:hypothetical protein
MSTAPTSLADGTDLLLTGPSFQEPAANIAECYDIPLATLDYIRVSANGQLVPILPASLIRSATTMHKRRSRRVTEELEDAQRRELSLSKASAACQLPASARSANAPITGANSREYSSVR